MTYAWTFIACVMLLPIFTVLCQLAKWMQHRAELAKLWNEAFTAGRESQDEAKKQFANIASAIAKKQGMMN